MKSLLRISLVTTGILSATLALNAQTATPPPVDTNAPVAPAAPGTTVAPGQAHGMFFRRAAIRHYIVRQLGLSSDQVTQIKTMRANTWATVKSIKADTTLTPDQQKAKIHETVTAAHQQMRSVLTPDQQAKLEEMRRNVRQAFDF